MSQTTLVLALMATAFCLSMAADITYYDNLGLGACGKQINPRTQMLAAVSSKKWTNPGGNPNNDPLCKNMCVTVKYKGKSVKVPILDKCPGCTKSADDVDLSIPAFKVLEPNYVQVGRLVGATTSIGKC